MRFGGVLVMIRMLSTPSRPSTMYAPIGGEQQRERLADHPAEQAAGLAERRQPGLRLRDASPATCRKPGDRDDEQPESDADAPVVVDGRRMPEHPAREHQQQHREDERLAAEEPADRVGADGRRDLGADEEPLDDRARDGEQHEEEREAVAALVLLERLGTECPEEPAGRMREAQPRPHDHRRLVGLADVALRRGRRLAGARGLALCARRAFRGRACAPGRTRHAVNAYDSAGTFARNDAALRRLLTRRMPDALSAGASPSCRARCRSA